MALTSKQSICTQYFDAPTLIQRFNSDAGNYMRIFFKAEQAVESGLRKSGGTNEKKVPGSSGYLLLVYQRSGLLLAPVFLRLAHIALVAELCHALGLGKEFFGLVGVGFLNRQIAHLAHEEVVEFVPIRLLRVE